jgi:hypothetical protein
MRRRSPSAALRPALAALVPLLAAAWLAIAFALAVAPATRADDPTPDAGAVPQTVDIALGSEPLVPYIVALLVTSGVLVVVGLVAMRVDRAPSAAARARRAALWTCAACSTENAGDRVTCFGCGAGHPG